VPIEAFVDRRNAEAIVNDRDTGTPTIESNGGDSLTMPKRMPDLPKLELDVREATQRYQVEIWAEKTTMNDILKPLAERYGIHIVTGAGELSITACHLFIERAKADRVRHQIPKTVNQETEGLAREMAREMGVPLITVEEEGTSGRPIRILYISDFDPSGQSMPVAVARKIEFLIRDQGLDLDVQVRPVVLTKKQCEEYQLPRTPIKETDVRRSAFEERHGEGATELDALEALHPGELGRILEREIARYWDDALEQETEDAAKPVQAELKRANAKVHKQHAKKIKSLRREYAKLMAARARWAKRATPVWHAIKKGLNAEAPDLDEVEWPESDEGDEDLDPLFSSKRGYVEQIDRYKKFQIKTTAFAPRVQGKRYTKGKKVKRGKSKP
jgi:hypothetical protein